jgi:hypothetical protein
MMRRKMGISNRIESTFDCSSSGAKRLQQA